MNKQDSDVLLTLYKEPFINQRLLAKSAGHSLGIVNKSIKDLISDKYLNDDVSLTKKSFDLINNNKPERAIILAAGFGMRMVPINTETPKALLKVNGECLIERQIKQLHSVGINEIYVVVGFMKECFEYLIDDFGVKLVVNTNYSRKNNLHSLNLVSDKLCNSYVIPCDVWCDTNPFNKQELYSWYMVSDLIDDDSEVRVNRKSELVRVSPYKSGNTMVGISYISSTDANRISKKIKKLSSNPLYDNSFWEEALYKDDKMIVSPNVVNSYDVVEINTYEQLRELDDKSEQLQSDAIMTIASKMNVNENDIENITVLKKGMTNRSFAFSCHNEKYIMRIPGEGTDKLINRKQEAEVYTIIKDKNICDNIVYINSNNGYKITKFLNNARVCDPNNETDVKHCMSFLRNFHNMNLKVNHEFDLFKQIDFYESLWNDIPSVYKDYKTTKTNVLSLKNYIDLNINKKVLTHIDAVPDNFLITKDGDDEKINLIDWEYAGMQDPHIDIAMFCIYSLYDKEQIDKTIDIYFENRCPEKIRTKIYCYISAAGLLWSNWCEYKRNLGVEFGEYSLKQYRYAKEFYRYANDRIDGGDNK